MIEFTIDTKFWLRGNRNGNDKNRISMLCDAEGHKCCLGHFGTHLSIPDENLLYARTPIHINSSMVSWPKELIDVYHGSEDRCLTSVCKSIIGTNDDAWQNDKSRKTTLTYLFEQMGYKPIFV
jgi:hypothetical protein